MEREDLMRQLAGWRDGIDPATRSTLAPDHPAQRTDFLRVVYAAIEALTPTPPGSRPMPATAPAMGRANAGRAWSAAEDVLLTQAYDAGMRVAELARAHERSPGAITARLVKLGKIDLPSGMRLRGMPPPAEGVTPPPP